MIVNRNKHARKKEYNIQSAFVRSSFVVDSTTIIRNNPCVDLISKDRSYNFP